MAKLKIIIIGAGGFAREVAWLLSEISRGPSPEEYTFLGYIVSDPSTVPLEYRPTVLGDFEWLKKNRSAFDGLVMGIGNPERRCALTRELNAALPGIAWPTLIHPSVKLDFESAKIERGVILCANVVGTVNLDIEEYSVVNLSCTIGHEAKIGPCSVINPSVNLSGGVTVEREVLVGTGAQILQSLTIGAGGTVGAGSVVTKNVESGTTVVGVPAKPIRAKSLESKTPGAR